MFAARLRCRVYPALPEINEGCLLWAQGAGLISQRGEGRAAPATTTTTTTPIHPKILGHSAGSQHHLKLLPASQDPPADALSATPTSPTPGLLHLLLRSHSFRSWIQVLSQGSLLIYLTYHATYCPTHGLSSPSRSPCPLLQGPRVPLHVSVRSLKSLQMVFCTRVVTISSCCRAESGNDRKRSFCPGSGRPSRLGQNRNPRVGKGIVGGEAGRLPAPHPAGMTWVLKEEEESQGQRP